MGCYPPLAKFVSKALRKCNGRERWRKERLDYAMAYPPGLPMETHYMPPGARTVTFASNNNVYVIPPQQKPPSPQPQEQPPPQQSTPEVQQPQEPPQPEPDHHDTPPAQPQPEPPAPAQEKAEDAPPPAAEPKPARGPKRGKNKKSGRVRFGPEAPPPPEEQQPQQEEEHPPVPGNGGGAPPGQGQGQRGDGPRGPAPPAHQMPAYLFRYTPSPLPRWEATPRRHEYFSGEYRSYYPTPVREGIYRIATDANRLTTIFSEENPNACAIV